MQPYKCNFIEAKKPQKLPLKTINPLFDHIIVFIYTWNKK